MELEDARGADVQVDRWRGGSRLWTWNRYPTGMVEVSGSETRTSGAE